MLLVTAEAISNHHSVAQDLQTVNSLPRGQKLKKSKHSIAYGHKRSHTAVAIGVFTPHRPKTIVHDGQVYVQA